MECLNVYVLTTLSVDAEGNVTSGNVGVTFDLLKAEAHRAHGVENDFESFVVPGNCGARMLSNPVWSQQCAREMVQQIQEAALR